jgi:hypothetical protein
MCLALSEVECMPALWPIFETSTLPILGGIFLTFSFCDLDTL